MARLEYNVIESVDFNGYELIIPGVSVGNAGSLALDILLNSKPHRIVGRFLSGHFQPFVGINALDTVRSNLHTNLEVFVSENNYAVLQIRAPPSIRRVPDFIEKLVAWAKDAGFARIITLSSLIDELRPNAQEPDVFYMRNAKFEMEYELPGKDFKNEDDADRLGGSGLVKKLLKIEDFPVAAVCVYA